ncbi:HAD family hydrolase [Phocaeicola paurosaccharolyticus]|uniref:HAD family hydrolase n=1 Tax=Phocaeicola paurosaccharolyticus TaxID=732242 RepID=UPI0005502605|nr:HAD family hydrolase [Phocaeicola paurosaccharolyticus]
MSHKFVRKRKETKPVVAICYDFDKTLSPDDMQAQGFIQSVNYDVESFWKESNGLAENNDMDQNLAYMFTMKKKAHGKLVFTKEKLMEYGSRVELFKGVDKWFRRIKEYGESKGVIVEHYIISSGLKEMIEGTKVADEFEKIYASSFYYDEDGVVLWPAQVVNYTSKTQFLFRIEKGTLDVNDPDVNNYFKPDEIRVPFRNIIYIGDSDTDIPCMKLVNTNQGHSIGVYNPKTKDKRKVYKMMRDNRIKYFAPADYSDESELDKLVKSIIDRTESNEKLEYIHYQNMNDFAEFDTLINAETKKRNDLIISLENSGSFASTHSIIAKLSVFSKWTDDEKSWLKEIKEKNSQVRLIAEDLDVDEFYKSF